MWSLATVSHSVRRYYPPYPYTAPVLMSPETFSLIHLTILVYICTQLYVRPAGKLSSPLHCHSADVVKTFPRAYMSRDFTWTRCLRVRYGAADVHSKLVECLIKQGVAFFHVFLHARPKRLEEIRHIVRL